MELELNWVFFPNLSFSYFLGFRFFSFVSSSSCLFFLFQASFWCAALQALIKKKFKVRCFTSFVLFPIALVLLLFVLAITLMLLLLVLAITFGHLAVHVGYLPWSFCCLCLSSPLSSCCLCLSSPLSS